MKADAVVELVPVVGTARACRAMEVARATHYRRRRPRLVPEPKPRPTPARALSERERAAVLELLHGDRFCDRSPAEVYATLLDEGTYSPANGRCIASWPATRRSASVATSCATPAT